MTISPKTYLVTGAARGIGRGLVAALLLRENAVVIAGVRDPAASTAKSLDDLPKGASSKLIVTKIDASSDTDALAAVKQLQESHSIERLDVIFANAGVSQNPMSPVHTTPITEYRRLLDTNTLGPIRLFTAIYHLLKPGARFVVVSSGAGSIQTVLSGVFPFQVAAYGVSKAGVNYFVAKASSENPDLVITTVHPGVVDTDMARSAGEALEKSDFERISVEESVNGMLALLERPKEEVGGKFLDWKGETIPW